MTYVPQVNRVALDVIVDGLVKRLREIKCKPEDCNYVVTRVVLEALKPDTGWDYHSLSDAVRVLKDSATEIERRLLGPYEDTAILKNGDLPCFQEPYTRHPVASEQIMENGKFRTRCLPRELERQEHQDVAAKLQEALTLKAIKRQEEGYKSPWEIKKERDSKFEMDEENKEKFDQMCKKQTNLWGEE